MGDVRPPTIVTQNRVWSADELTALAYRWRASALGELAGRTAPVALALTSEPQAVALFFALSTLAAPLVLLPADPRGWLTSPRVPLNTPLVLLESQAMLADRGRALGFDVRVLPGVDSTGPGDGAVVPFLCSPGIVMLTSGSTAAPKPVYRLMSATVDSLRFRIDALGLSSSSHIVGSLPLDRAAAVSHALLLPALLGSRLALLDPGDYRGILRCFATGKYEHWTGTPAIADVLVRAAGGRHRAPRMCLSAGRVGPQLFDRFLQTFGVPLRGFYGATEAPWIAVDTRPAADVRAGVAGPPASVVGVRIGVRPDRLVDHGETGRIWVKSPWSLEGYGFPPDLESAEEIDGWLGTRDLGRFEEDGSLAVVGRLDDTVRTGAGHLVNLALIAQALLDHANVREAVAVPLESPGGSVIGTLVEVVGDTNAADLRAHLQRSLAPAFQPRVVVTTDGLPRLADGRPDRRACIARLERPQ